MSKKRVLIFGGTGMLGSDFSESQKAYFDIIPLSGGACDVTSFPLVLNQISLHAPDIILNLAAYINVEQAESEGMMEAFMVNALGAQNVAKAASAFGIPLIHISTDYIFDGEESSGYSPTDMPYPINNYGMSKYLGEELLRREYSEAIIIRTSALYGGLLFGQPGAKKNFINSLLERNRKNAPLHVVSDAYTVPTACLDLSNSLREVIDNLEAYEGEILHFASKTDEGGVSWYDYASELTKYLPELINIVPISSREYESTVKRSKYSILKNTSTIKLPHWRKSLEYYFLKKK